MKNEINHLRIVYALSGSVLYMSIGVIYVSGI